MAYGHEQAEWRRAVADMTEWDWAAYDEPETYADTHGSAATR